jgi:hypothetical protein
MYHLDRYRMYILTAIAGALLSITVAPVRIRSVSAQSSTAHYSVEVVTGDWSGTHAASINRAANARDLISVIPHDQPGKYLAVFKQNH